MLQCSLQSNSRQVGLQQNRCEVNFTKEALYERPCMIMCHDWCRHDPARESRVSGAIACWPYSAAGHYLLLQCCGVLAGTR